MNKLGIFVKDIGYDSGVVVSVRHLENTLRNAGISADVCYYSSDIELVKMIAGSNYACINLHALSYTDDTLNRILKIHDNVVVSIHSTLCNLQTEGDALERLIRYGNGTYRNLRFTCPSLCETVGFNEFFRNEYLYLPNTFSYKCDDERLESSIRERAERRTKKISLFSAYRPFKNMITQAAAVEMLSSILDVELHLIDTQSKSPIYKNLIKLTQMRDVPVIVHPQTDNYSCFVQEGDFDLGMQVSLSETFSYVAFEHMIQGIPVLGSDSVPFSSRIASYSNVVDMKNKMYDLLSEPVRYIEASHNARQTAMDVNSENMHEAVQTVRQMLGE